MNESDEPLPDAELSELLEPLRGVSVPDAVRTANRNAIASTLARQRRPHWWQRSVAVPIPLAVAAGIALVATTIALLFQTSNWRMGGADVAPSNTQQVMSKDLASRIAEDRPTTAGWTITRSYIGTLQSLAMPQAPADFVTKENRDDS
jgi:hypothetical protein